MTSREYNKAVDLYADNVFRFVLKQIKNRMSADDIVQEAFTRIWVRHESISFETVKSYLFRTAYTVMVDWLKQEHRSASLEMDVAFSETPAHDVHSVIQEALGKLPQLQQSVLMLRDYEGYSYQEIAEITQLNESQVKVYIFRARQAMKNYLVHPEILL